MKLVGGFVNTPIFAFRKNNAFAKKNSEYFKDLKTQNIITKFQEAKKLATHYSKNAQLVLIN